jgi:hypothetical protein
MILKLLILPFLLVAHAGKPVLVDGTAATVGKVLITVQDAYFFRAVQRFKDNEGTDLFRKEEGDELRRTVQKMIFEQMVYSEMQSFQFEGGGRGEAEKIVHGRRALVKSSLWQRLLSEFGKNESAVIESIARSLKVEKFIQKKVETLTPIITQAEVDRYYNQNKARFEGGDYEALKPKIVLLLKKERMQKGLEEWVRFLRDKYGVTNYLAG